MNPVIGHCRKCRSPITQGMEIRPNGDTFHSSCWKAVEDELADFNSALDGMDKITDFTVQLDVEQMREDGVLNRLEDFTVERFKVMMEERAVRSNAETSTVSIVPVIRGERKNYKLSCTLTVKKDKTFSYKFGGVFWFLWYGFTGRLRAKAMLYYLMDVKDSKSGQGMRDCVRETIMAILWKVSPNMDAIAERQKPL